MLCSLSLVIAFLSGGPRSAALCEAVRETGGVAAREGSAGEGHCPVDRAGVFFVSISLQSLVCLWLFQLNTDLKCRNAPHFLIVRFQRKIIVVGLLIIKIIKSHLSDQVDGPNGRFARRPATSFGAGDQRGWLLIGLISLIIRYLSVFMSLLRFVVHFLVFNYNRVCSANHAAARRVVPTPAPEHSGRGRTVHHVLGGQLGGTL